MIDYVHRLGELGSVGVGAGLYMYDVVVKSSGSLSHLLMSSCVSCHRADIIRATVVVCRITTTATTTVLRPLCRTTGVSGNEKEIKLECGPMPNVMVALLNIGGAVCSMPQFG